MTARPRPVHARRRRLRPEGRHDLGGLQRLVRATTASPSTTCSTPTTRRRPRRTSPATSTSRGTRRWRGCAPVASPPPPVATARAVAMRDTDQDLTSVVLVRADSDITDVGAARRAHRRDRRRRLAAGDAAAARPPRRRSASTRAPSFTVRRFDVMVGKHGDHVGGERDAVKALVAGEVDAACVIDGNQLAFAKEGTIDAGRGAGPQPHRPVRPLHDDRARRRRRRRPSTGSSSCCCRCRSTTPTCARCSSSKGCSSGGRAGPPATRSSRRPSTGSASTAPTGRSWSRGTRPVSRAAADRRARRARVRRRRPRPRQAGARRPAAPATRSRCAARHPELARHLATWCRQQGHRWRPRRRAAGGTVGHRRARRGRRRPLGRRRPRRRCRPDDDRSLPTSRRPTGASPPAARRSSPADRRPAFRLDRRDEVWTDRAGRPLRPGRSPRSGTPTTAIDWTAADRPRPPRRGRGRAGDDVPDRERGGRARRAGPVPRPDPPALPRDPAGARDHRRRRGPPHRGLHPPRHDHAADRSPCRPSAAGRRCRRCSTSPTSPSPRSCCR